MQVDNTDSASLHFESILEGDINHVGDLSGKDSSGHNFLFDLHRDNYDIPRNNGNPVAQCSGMASYENTDINGDIERKKCEFTYQYPNGELSNNALFNKFRESADGCSTSAGEDLTTHRIGNNEETSEHDESSDELSECKLKDSNSVSCEDLLEFANRKPKGKERGVESDEVRIMTKVLGTNVSHSIIIVIQPHSEYSKIL